MRYGLISPTAVSIHSNAGWHFITAGIKYLIRLADPEAEFTYVDFFDKDKWWPTNPFMTFDWVVICGNPRYSTGADDEWLYVGMLTLLKKIHDLTGVQVLDAWQGAGAPLGKSSGENAIELYRLAHNREIIRLLKSMKAKVITRCATSQRINEIGDLESVQMPCSSFWGAHEIVRDFPNQTFPKADKKIVIPFHMEGFEGAAGIMRTLSRTHEIYATCILDSEWLSAIGLKHIMIYDPTDLVNLYLQSKEVISYRLHAAIPAASVGCKVFYSAIDSRGETCESFKIPYADYRGGIYEPALAVRPAAPDLKEILGVSE